MSSDRTVVHTDRAPAAVGPYSQAIRRGPMLFTSGQVALDPSTGAMVGEGDVVAQTRQVLDNLGAVLEAGGGDFSSIVKATIFLKDMGDFGRVNEVYAERFAGEPPARSCVEVARLPKDALVEIEAIAFVPGAA